MAIEQFEWQGEVELTEPSQERLEEVRGNQLESVWTRVRKSVWFEPALRLCGMALLLAVLAGIGMIAANSAKPGLSLPEGSRAAALVIGTSWLKPTPGVDASATRLPGSRAITTEPGVGAATAAGAVAGAGTTAAAGAGTTAAAGAETASPPAPIEPAGGSKPSGITSEGRVILNVASAEELTQLPGVGMKRAQAIVALRTKLKRFKHPSDLLRVKGIGPRGLQRMLPHLVLD